MGKDLSGGGGSLENPLTQQQSDGGRNTLCFQLCGAELLDLCRAEHQAHPISLGCSVKDAPKIFRIVGLSIWLCPGSSPLHLSMDGFLLLYFFATLSTWDLHFLPPCIPVSACVWLYGTAVAEEPCLQWRSLRSWYLSIPGCISPMDFCYFSINGCFIPYFHVLNHKQNQILAMQQKNRAKGHLKCVPKTIMGPEDCAVPHVSFLWKSVRAQVRL